MALTISDMTVDTTIADGSIIPFIKDDGAGGYLNRSIEAQDLKTYMQTGITPLPPGTAGKVMYYSTAWGKSANFETDGTNVAIGQTVAFKSSRLTVYDGSGSKDYTLFLQNGNTKLVTHKHGTTFIGNYDTNKETSGFGTAIKLYNQGNFYNESDVIVNNTSLIKFGTIDNNGIVTDSFRVGSFLTGGYMTSKNYSSVMYCYADAVENIASFGNNGIFPVGVSSNLINGKRATYIGVNGNEHFTDTDQAGTTIGNSGKFTGISIRMQRVISKETSTNYVYCDYMDDGTINFYNVPTILGGIFSGTLKVDTGAGNVLKLA